MSKHDIIPKERSEAEERTVSKRVMELVVAALFMITAAVVMKDSWRIGAGWVDGPESGYFPFYVGLIMFIASAITFVSHLATQTPDLETFVKRSQLNLVMKVLVPTAIYVVLIGYIGIYVASAAYIVFFMMWIGKYSIVKALPIAIIVPLVLFWMFEIAFLVPLPKGPLEAALGY